MFTLYIALLFRIISNPVANLIQKKLSNTNSTLALNLYSSLFMALLCSPFSFKVDFLSFGWNFYSLVLLSGFFCFMGTICLIKALKIGEMSVLGPINSYKSVIGLVFAFLLLKETPSIKALIGFLFIISASFLFADEKGKFLLNKSVILRLLALLFTGVEAVILKKIILLSSPIVCFILWCFMSLFFSLIFALVFNSVKLNSKKSLFYCAIIALLLCIMQLSTNIVFEHLEVGLSLSLFQLSSVVSLILGFKVFGEKGIIKKSLGTIIMLFGSFLILIK